MKIARPRDGKIPALGVCNHCGHLVLLSTSTNVCGCGVYYNSAGQELAPPQFWGEETGEDFLDIWNGRGDE